MVKRLLAALTALMILNAFCAWYYNPAPYLSSPDRATDTVRTPGARTSQAREGIGAHRIDAQGYNNARAAEPGEIGVLMMGSSHTEGFNVAAGRDVSSQLQALLAQDGGGETVYNIGMSSHTFTRNAANLSRALARFRPSGWVVLETDSVALWADAVHAAYYDEMEPLPATDVPLPLLSGQPLAKRLYKQVMSLLKLDDEGTAVTDADLTDELLADYEDILTMWFEKLNASATQAGARLMIWYHPHLEIALDGTARAKALEPCRAAFAGACARAGVTFVDLTDVFLDAYAREHILPHGFDNTAMGHGHLNADGHRMAAESIRAAMRAAEVSA